MDNIISRPDIAAQREAAQNTAFGLASTHIVERASSFGVQPVSIFIYNIGPLEFNEPRYPNHPHILIRRCPQDKEWVLATSLQHPFEEKRFDSNGNPFTVYTDGYLEASRTLNPMNPGSDQSWGCDDPINVGSNWSALGVFWSTHYPPLESEIKACRDRMEKSFKEELEVLVSEEAKSPEAAKVRANDISHAAANYFGQSFSWHRSDLTRKSADAGKLPCQVCGELVQKNAKLCVHCGCPDPAEEISAKRDGWLERKFRAPNRPRETD